MVHDGFSVVGVVDVDDDDDGLVSSVAVVVSSF